MILNLPQPLNSDGQETIQSDAMVEDSTGGSSTGSHHSQSQSVQPRRSEEYEKPNEESCPYQFPHTHPAALGSTGTF